MTSEYVMELFYNAMKVALIIASPLLLAALISGLIISILQAATQVNEQTLSFIPKIISVLGVISILGPWMLGVMLDYMHNLFNNIILIIK
ncbi:flagellar biosynthesis protein FliQ [Buchnera aphidicola str. APS (Acyrthosiphon pisum)]|uniref:Flagellar biosynthetic protein FliQ n=2 Tax=Buchnera aphidicola TaxID=9 RepID=FLIQ_BUCAI|nr:flagellar biosynthesis protein FliQ [Buchnera aphidicola]P57185.1 RecName: Full=Flagellar biosynthetic protein FliQ [Buchnera aphidicola str. APS (Acyrthosiphon pisum)]pir/C84939/ flagellar biosynthetic protein fliQ [imported] - Buchnera sp. (strain APS) [Buchnera sp. (in: enterobacteria)]ADP67633.1 flagellar biosynthetic protein FliQ [Buchnera aphidicola str. JF98 (Acyrthosiphon pisum)]OQX98776.1 MAG: flagellar biosynthetic protein FliQ [Erwiniaceae bacterium 4572_131]ACL30459.1 flagellar 